MITHTKVGLDRAIATALADHLSQERFNGCDVAPLWELLRTGYGVLSATFLGGRFGANEVLVAYQDDQGNTNVYSDRITYRSVDWTHVTAQIMSDPAEVVYLQPNGDRASAGSSSMLYAQKRGERPDLLFKITELTDLGVPTFIAGYRAGLWDGGIVP